MNTTSVTLLERLRQPSAAGAWERFVRLYTPLLLHWSRGLGLKEHDAADLVQDVLLMLLHKLPDFEYQQGRKFRGWLRTVLTNKWRDRRQNGWRAPLDGANEPEARFEADNVEEREYRLYIMGRALKLMVNDFDASTWQACWETVVCDRPAADVAAELGVSVNAVYLAKARVLARLRCDLKGLVD
jgi:RNA polymerase sigma-70 factor, ECF subfamily